MGDYYIPRTARELRIWLTNRVKNPSGLSGLKKAQLYAMFYRVLKDHEIRSINSFTKGGVY